MIAAYPVRRLVLLCAGVAVAAALSACGSSTGNTGTPAQLVQAGLLATSKGADDAAVAAFRQAVVLEPQNVLAHYNLGVIYQKRDQTAAALSEYAAALASDPKYVPALYNSATVVAKTNPRLAVSTYQQVLTLAPKNAAANLNLGLLELQLGMSVAARAHVAAAVALDKTLLPRVPAVLLPTGTPFASATPSHS